MKAVRLYEYGGPENLTYEDNVPEPTIGADSVLVESSAASVNPIDWKIRSGARQKDFPLKLPAILGMCIRQSRLRPYRHSDAVKTTIISPDKMG